MTRSQHPAEQLPIINTSTRRPAPEANQPVKHSMERGKHPIIKSSIVSGAAKAIQEVHHSIMGLPPSSQRQQEELPIDSNSTISSDIIKIWHDVDSKQICVALKQGARCQHPALIGRRSGPGLAILEWKEDHSIGNDDGSVLCGSYSHHWLDAGSYFVEILILFCKDFGVNALQRTNNTAAWMEANHKFDCVEDPDHNRITAKDENAMIHIPNLIEGRDSYQLGRWVRKKGLPSQAIFTRYQPNGCFRANYTEGSPEQLRCSSAMERDHEAMNESDTATGLYEYEFQWKMKVSEQELIDKLRQRKLAKNVPRICAVGDSHSKWMARTTAPNLNLKGIFKFVASHWVDPDGIIDKIKGLDCDVFFVQVGLWPASFQTKGRPWTFGEYHDKLKRHVQNILKHNPNAMIYLPTIDVGPLMNKVIQCDDWRTPTFLDGNSLMNQKVVQELSTPQVKYIDTAFIIYTHWDGHSDWQHLMETVRQRKTLYMAAVMLKETVYFDVPIEGITENS